MTKRKKKRRTGPVFMDPEDQRFIDWASRVTAGIDTSDCMLGMMDAATLRGKTRGRNYWMFAVQVGHSLMTGKPLVLVLPSGHDPQPKLIAAATIVEYYLEDNDASLSDALKRVYAAMGRDVQH